jgi:hypothetical protein
MSYDEERDEVYEDEDGMFEDVPKTNEGKFPSELYDRGIL